MAITVHNGGDISKVPQTRKINNKSLDADITLSARESLVLENHAQIAQLLVDDANDKYTLSLIESGVL